MNAVRTSPSAYVPEVGPALGRLTALAGAPVGAPPAPRLELAELRLALVGRIFDLAATARQAADAEAAAEVLSPERLRQEWERAAAQVADRSLARIGEMLATGARRSGIPDRRFRRALPTPDEAALLKARLQGAGVPFVDGVAALDVAEAGSDEWRRALIDAMRSLESCWLALEQRARDEEEAWVGEAERLAVWRPSPWPRRIVAGAILLCFLYAGLVFGGFLPAPGFAKPIAEWWWARDTQ